MAEEVRIWTIRDERLAELSRARLDLENRLESWLTLDISVLDRDLLVIGRQVTTDFGGIIDLLCLDRKGDVVVVELKRDKTSREITAQVLDYGSWVGDLSGEKIAEISARLLGSGNLENAFRSRFGCEFPDTLNENHRLVIVGSEIDASSERIVRYLSGTYGVSINAATFQYFKLPDGSELLARTFLIEPEEVELKSRTKGASKRRPNLTPAELEAVADEYGAGELYRYAVSAFEKSLSRQTTLSSIGFATNIEGSRKVVISLVPAESHATEGVRFHIFVLRLAKVLGISEDEVVKLLPSAREPWVYSAGTGPDWEGFQGFFANRTEIDLLASALGRATVVDRRGVTTTSVSRRS